MFTISNLLLPTVLATLLGRYASPTHRQRLLIKCFSLLLLGMFLATLATINFSLAFLIGLLAYPLSILGVPQSDPPEESSRSPLMVLTAALSNVVLHSLSPPVVLAAVCYYSGVGVEEVLLQAAFGWEVSGLWTQVIVWCVWWPAWLIGAAFVSPQYNW